MIGVKMSGCCTFNFHKLSYDYTYCKKLILEPLNSNYDHQYIDTKSSFSQFTSSVSHGKLQFIFEEILEIVELAEKAYQREIIKGIARNKNFKQRIQFAVLNFIQQYNFEAKTFHN